VNVSLRLLRAFISVSQEGNVGRAAARLFVSQPSLSQDIRRLEREVAVKLFVRGPQGMALTAPGQELARCVEAALAQIDLGVEQARRLEASDQRRLLIAFSPSIGNKLMPELLPALEGRLRGVSIDEREVDTGEVGPGVRIGRFDAGLAHCPDNEPGLVATLLVEEPMCIALASEHPLASRDTLRLAELADLALLIWPRESAPHYFDRVMQICERSGLRPPVVRSARRTIVRSYLLAEGDSFSLLPSSTAALQPPGISFVTVADDDVTVPLMFLRRVDDEREELRAIELIAREMSACLSATA
jgi:DNA-binding transcriptional LysR family regulator